MAYEAEILDISKPGENTEITVSFKDDGAEIGRETISIKGVSNVDENTVRSRIEAIGSRIFFAKRTESLVKTLIGRKFPITPVLAPEGGINRAGVGDIL